MAGDGEHKPLKPAHPAVKSIAGAVSSLAQSSSVGSINISLSSLFATQDPSEVLLRHAACNLLMSSKLGCN